MASIRMKYTNEIHIKILLLSRRPLVLRVFRMGCITNHKRLRTTGIVHV